MSEKFTVFIMDGSGNPMISVKEERKRVPGSKSALAQVGKVFASKEKTREQVAKELAEAILSNSRVMGDWFDGKMTLKQKLVKKYGPDAGFQVYRLLQRNQSMGRSIVQMRQHLDKFDAGSVCSYCGTYHPQGTKSLIIDPTNGTFCNYGCREQFVNNEKLEKELVAEEETPKKEG